MSASPVTASPIADLSYRNYDGPLESPELRWWVIAKRVILSAIKMKSLWVLTAFAGWYFVVELIILFFIQQLQTANPRFEQAFKTILGGTVWKDQFLHGFSFGQHWFLVITLLIGAGAIANDNRANALLVYLSKPCSKMDYILGKWVGIFLILLTSMTLPCLVFYGYGALSFSSQGFVKQDPWLIFRVLAILPLAAAFHTSLILAVSSLFRQGRIAGATYAGMYFLSYFFTLLMQMTWTISNEQASPLVKSLFYCSIDGVQIGLARAILRPDGTNWFALPGKIPDFIGPPPLASALLVVLVVVAASFGVMWTRVRAVEVV